MYFSVWLPWIELDLLVELKNQNNPWATKRSLASCGCLREVLYLQYDWFMVALKYMYHEQIIIKVVLKAYDHLKWGIVFEGTILYCFQIRRYIGALYCVPETLSMQFMDIYMSIKEIGYCYLHCTCIAFKDSIKS